MTILGVPVSAHDLVFGLLAAPLVLVALWAGVAMLFALAPA